MDHKRAVGVLSNEKGILEKDGVHFHAASEFATEHLFYLMFGAKYTCRPPYSVERTVALDAFLMFYLIRGSMRFEYLGEAFTAGPNDAVLIDCKHIHRYEATDTAEFFWFHFNGKIAQPYFDRITGLRVPHMHSYSAEKHFVRIHEMMRENAVDEDMFSAAIHLILARFVTTRIGLSPEIEAAKTLIEQRFRSALSVDAIAESAMLSKSHFSRRFRRETGMSPHRYLMEVRINYAKHLLIETSMSIEQIANACAFCSPSNYIRTFRGITGVTPMQFRNSVS